MRALTAIIQQMMEERYASDRASRRVFFKERLEDDDPVTMAIATLLTPGEIEEAFRWVEDLDGAVDHVGYRIFWSIERDTDDFRATPRYGSSRKRHKARADQRHQARNDAPCDCKP